MTCPNDSPETPVLSNYNVEVWTGGEEPILFSQLASEIREQIQTDYALGHCMGCVRRIGIDIHWRVCL